MNWGFLAEFWDTISSQTVGGVEYGINWFKQIGLAVAGAIGSIFEYLIHAVSDVFVFLGWIFSALKQVILALLLPLTYLFNFLKGFLTNAIKTPIVPETSYAFSSSTMAIFNKIPYWSVLSHILGIALMIIAGFAILRTVSKV
jgi:hypothetical protein